MNDISALDDSRLFAPPPTAAARDELGQEDFLTLMITQFRNQDPFEPMDNGDFLGQLAQFGTVNGIEELNSSFAGLTGTIQNDQALKAANLVGHSVLAGIDVGYLPKDGQLSGAVELNSSVSNVQVEITDATGQLVQRLELGEQPRGLARFEWDGRDLNGDSVDAGHFLVSTRVIRGTNIESAETLLESNIESVSLGRFGEGLTLNLLGGDTLSLDQVRRIL
jgi:flagellar basal-body rod modification protein FlgD